MTVRDIERLVITREPITVNHSVCRLVSFTIVWTPQGIDYIADVMDGRGRRFRARMSDLSYLDGRSSI